MPIINLNEQEPREIVAGYFAKIAHSQNMTVVHWEIEARADLDEHVHNYEQITTVIEGEFQVALNGEIYKLKAGDVIVIPKNTKHSGLALTKCKTIDIFTPVRKDYLRGETEGHNEFL